ncbi:hypothetical protein RJ40_04675 [Methanofollis aquaemaris]|uniref:SipW-cognate class signal peptide n=1 Tax=Methanofollis aquaemaris TaxID=126734 RepID=A0A8A3S3I9_9EURY|nr:TasA family protein [Methanofollis aquaemaris]QSZ66837.1 hypothetical protein RJ40_04675 [Methanofollis aquaemaris]
MDQTKKIILTSLGVALIAFFIGGGTYAYFSDVEEVQNSTFTAGTLDLVVGNTTLPVVVNPLKPGDYNESYAELILNNTGNVAGVLNVSVGGLATNEGGVGTEPENVSEALLGGPIGLEKRLKVALLLDNGTGSGYHLIPDIGDSSLVWASSGDPSNDNNYFLLDNFSNTNTTTGSPQVDASPNIGTFTIAYKLPYETGNEVQGDSCSFNITFMLKQA